MFVCLDPFFPTPSAPLWTFMSFIPSSLAYYYSHCYYSSFSLSKVTALHLISLKWKINIAKGSRQRHANAWKRSAITAVFVNICDIFIPYLLGYVFGYILFLLPPQSITQHFLYPPVYIDVKIFTKVDSFFMQMPNLSII